MKTLRLNQEEAIELLFTILEEPNQSIGICSSRLDMSKDILNNMRSKLKKESLLVNNKKTIKLNNGSQIIVQAINYNAFRGRSMNCVYVDNYDQISSKYIQELEDCLLPCMETYSHERNTIYIKGK